MDDLHKPFVTEEFVEMISKYAKVKHINNIPTINGRTYFWANKKFEGVKKQYIVGGEKSSPKKYFVKFPSNYEETYKNYKKFFRKSLKQSQKTLKLEVKTSVEDPRVHYKIYKDVMIRNNTFVFPFSFFKDAMNLSFAKIYEARLDDKVIAFSLMLYKNLFFQFALSDFFNHRPNQFLLDAIYKDFENEFVYLGTSFANSGHHRFKEASTARPMNCSPYPYHGEFHLAKAFLKLPLGPIYRLLSNNKFAVGGFLPY